MSVSVPIAATHHVGLQVADIERSRRFYRDVLGLEEVFAWNPQAEYLETLVGYPGVDLHIVVMRLPGTEALLELLEYRNVDRTPVDTRTANPGTSHLAFRVASVDMEYERLSSLGVRFVSEPVTPTSGPNEGGRAVYLLDPDGIRVELIETATPMAEFRPPSPTSEGTGAVSRRPSREMP